MVIEEVVIVDHAQIWHLSESQKIAVKKVSLNLKVSINTLCNLPSEHAIRKVTIDIKDMLFLQSMHQYLIAFFQDANEITGPAATYNLERTFITLHICGVVIEGRLRSTRNKKKNTAFK